ncbi:4-hydroxybenzoyl-CoA thioesterase family active site [Pseudonocardia sp. Ae168_Ps1]|jgi:acyl-CoA thioester hydrolase|uniref:acyl-CoA thioesterase n=1 Tax=unclassified Pseudonocardia TaxID=2619320 RepID=UPI0001FFEE2B|nr:MULTISPECIES: acyl-CoA thioesterase [unclassified Pseudonocardia]ALE75126.1 4-hydroxybenzoyl-CoA thioesterase [Pseudonocardia sp. EC080625-04]ALL74486.1 4-hydroxybenzoyl-CoA thioesterase [Pseudonocardia sp. EC080610-09]ALL81506.1 4-hydroxybenzoyl-CoA thioesterase [Pseudonocardia sp. EC080619-01]OLL75493.1 4-hydroxybenzoyl-CoA thioesterase family active site [Pseudonocardia sp. Ae150A_Ps1]OLL81488.1 4-hydroxybenzoyl-CoA thioesterase family active site [Pseudonocardia sp. Ae168_Ps1]
MASFEFPVRVRYHEVDAQGVVFNAWYLAWFDEAMTEFLEFRGLTYRAMLDAGFDVQLVHTEIDWRAGVGWGEDVAVAVSTARLGRTSFALDFQVRSTGEDGEVVVTCDCRTVYVVIAVDGSGKQEIPPLIRHALGEPEPMLPFA